MYELVGALVLPSPPHKQLLRVMITLCAPHTRVAPVLRTRRAFCTTTQSVDPAHLVLYPKSPGALLFWREVTFGCEERAMHPVGFIRPPRRELVVGCNTPTTPTTPWVERCSATSRRSHRRDALEITRATQRPQGTFTLRALVPVVAVTPSASHLL